MTTQNNTDVLKTLQNPYVGILRQKIGEFMLIHNDLEEKRGIKLESTLNEVINIGDARGLKTSIKDIATKIITQKADTSTGDWANETHIALLSALLCNNGFPCQIIIKRLTTDNATEQKYPSQENVNFTYKMPMVFAGAEGEETVTHNHYTFIIPTDMKEKITIPENLKKLLTDDMEETKLVTEGMTKYKTSTDGHCFYRAVANWCIIYGITTDHLKNMTYNIPFTFSEEHYNTNLKVPKSSEDIPKPIEFPKDGNDDTYGFFKFIKTDALKIAQNMKNKIQHTDFNPTFEDTFENITDSQEYKYYETNGMTKDNGTHCNKYTGNKENKETKEEVVEN
jgi:hypothetical protein